VLTIPKSVVEEQAAIVPLFFLRLTRRMSRRAALSRTPRRAARPHAWLLWALPVPV